MQFVQIGMLGALAALAIPVVLHLLFRARPRTVELGTLQFLWVVLRDHARSRRLKRWMLLALRLACVALLALLFARPYLFAIEPSAIDRLVVILIDRSASMGRKGPPRPIDRALAEARAVIAASGAKAVVEIAAFDTAVFPIKSLDGPGSSPPVPSASGTDYAAAMAWARDRCAGSPKRFRDVYVFTDLQRSGLSRGEAVTMPPGAEVRVVDVGRPVRRNVAVTAVAVSPETVRPGGSAAVSVRVENDSPLPVAGVPVRLHLESGGAVRDLETAIDLGGGATHAATLELTELPEGIWQGSVSAAVEGDEIEVDNRRYLALAVAPPTPIRLVDGDPGDTTFHSETYFLEAALRLAPRGERFAMSPFDPSVVNVSDEQAFSDLDGVGAVVLANVGTLGAPDALRLSRFVASGGGLLVFTGDGVGPGVGQALAAAGLGVGKVDGPAAVDGLPWRLARWESTHPIFAPFADPEHGDLRRPSFTRITQIEPDPSTRVLAAFRGGAPALLEREHGRGRVVWFASSCDRDWGDWPRGRMYVPLVHRMVGYVLGRRGQEPIRQEGPGEGRRLGVREEDGVVRVVNADPFESDTSRCTSAEFARRFGFRPAPAMVGASRPGPRATPAAPPDGRLRPDEIWPWLAAALLGVLLVEEFLANRTAA